MTAQARTPFRAMVICAFVVTVASMIAVVPASLPNRVTISADCPIEVAWPGRQRVIIVFDSAPDACTALALAGFKGECVLKGLSRAGMSISVLPDGSVVQGWMSGSDLLTFGIPVPINAATVSDLEAINGVGPSTARAMVRSRLKEGPFRSARDLRRVKGIGPKKGAVIDQYVSYSPWQSGEADPSR
ncbi:MAG TPA: helix-hairpin-helix domain-containing protein [Myxococcota bacterium]|nr:helix-hairpin-helix domain-containing protein [Myxococcota bacterium]HPB50810.1 helix-hairpin-helix domain-containing protein [Myxococcota bacterium]HQP94629.1 helix-hairpin-helix domain-containing protein [Myxococcota bacterium]